MGISPTPHIPSSEEEAEESAADASAEVVVVVAAAAAEGYRTPLNWLRMLCDEMHWSFVFGVIVIYGISQGLGGAVYRVASDYYWKDVQMVQPSEAQVYQGITSIPWLVKPLWGLLTDVLPIAGYRRRPYFILAGDEICPEIYGEYVGDAEITDVPSSSHDAE